MDPSGLLRYRDPCDPCDILTGVIYDTTTGNWWGLVGEWTIDDIRAWYFCEPEEVLSHKVAGITVYVVLDLGLRTLNPPGRRVDAGEIVYLEEWEKSELLFGIALTVTEPEPTGDIIGEGRSWPRPDWWPWPDMDYPTDWFGKIQYVVEEAIGVFVPPWLPVSNPDNAGDRNATMEGAAYSRTMEAAQQYDRWARFWRWWLFEFGF